MTNWFEELGLRNIIAYCIKEAAKYEKALEVLIAYTDKHYYKIFFRTIEGRQRAENALLKLEYLKIDKKTQDIQIQKYESEETVGKTYTGPLKDEHFMIELRDHTKKLLKEKGEADKLISKIMQEDDIVGHYNPHKLQKAFKLKNEKKYDYIIEQIKEKGYKASRPHNNRFGIKTNASGKEIVKIIKE